MLEAKEDLEDRFKELDWVELGLTSPTITIHENREDKLTIRFFVNIVDIPKEVIKVIDDWKSYWRFERFYGKFTSDFTTFEFVGLSTL